MKNFVVTAVGRETIASACLMVNNNITPTKKWGQVYFLDIGFLWKTSGRCYLHCFSAQITQFGMVGIAHYKQINDSRAKRVKSLLLTIGCKYRTKGDGSIYIFSGKEEGLEKSVHPLKSGPIAPSQIRRPQPPPTSTHPGINPYLDGRGKAS